MKAVERRIGRLEERLAPRSRDQIIYILRSARCHLALDDSRCVEILREAGRIDTVSPICLVDLMRLPNGLNAVELEKYLREHGTRPESLTRK